MSWQEWRDCPWWVQRAYIEGMEQEELIKYGPDEDDIVGATMGKFEEMGLTVIRGGGGDGI
jgi:hypothetical protein